MPPSPPPAARPTAAATAPRPGAEPGLDAGVRRMFGRLDRLRARLDRGGLAPEATVFAPGLGPIEALWAPDLPGAPHLWLAAGAELVALHLGDRPGPPQPRPVGQVRLPGRVRCLAWAPAALGTEGTARLWAGTDAGLFEVRVQPPQSPGGTGRAAPAAALVGFSVQRLDPEPAVCLGFDAHRGVLYAGGPHGLRWGRPGAPFAALPTRGSLTALALDRVPAPAGPAPAGPAPAGPPPAGAGDDHLYLSTDLGHLYRVGRDRAGDFVVGPALAAAPWLHAPGSAFKGLIPGHAGRADDPAGGPAHPPGETPRGVLVRSLRSLRRVVGAPAPAPTLAHPAPTPAHPAPTPAHPATGPSPGLTRWRPATEHPLVAHLILPAPALPASAPSTSAPANPAPTGPAPSPAPIPGPCALAATADGQLWILAPGTERAASPAADPQAPTTSTAAPGDVLGGRQWRVKLPAPARALAALPARALLAVGGADGRLHLFGYDAPDRVAARLEGTLARLGARLPGPALVAALVAEHARDPWSSAGRRRLLAALPAVLAQGAPAGWEALVHAALFPPGPETDALRFRALGSLRRALDAPLAGGAAALHPAGRAEVQRLIALLEDVGLTLDPAQAPDAELGAGGEDRGVPVGALEALAAEMRAEAVGAELGAPPDPASLARAATLASAGLDAAWRWRWPEAQAPGPLRAVLPAGPHAAEGALWILSARGLWRVQPPHPPVACPLPLAWGAPLAAMRATPTHAAAPALWLLTADGVVRHLPLDGPALAAVDAEATEGLATPTLSGGQRRRRLASRARPWRGRAPQAAPATALGQVDVEDPTAELPEGAPELLVGDADGGLCWVDAHRLRALPALAPGRGSPSATGSGSDRPAERHLDGPIRALAPLRWRDVHGPAQGWVAAVAEGPDPSAPGHLCLLVARPDGLRPVARQPCTLAGLRLLPWPAAGALIVADAQGRLTAWAPGDAGDGLRLHCLWARSVPAPVGALAILPAAPAAHAQVLDRPPTPEGSTLAEAGTLLVAGADAQLHRFDAEGGTLSARAVPGPTAWALLPDAVSRAEATAGVSGRALWVRPDGELWALRLLRRSHLSDRAETLAGPPTEGRLLAGRDLRLNAPWLRIRAVRASARYDRPFPEAVIAELAAWRRRAAAETGAAHDHASAPRASASDTADPIATDLVCALVRRLLAPPEAGRTGGLAALLAGDAPDPPAWRAARAALAALWRDFGAPGDDTRRRLRQTTIEALAASLEQPELALRWWRAGTRPPSAEGRGEPRPPGAQAVGAVPASGDEPPAPAPGAADAMLRQGLTDPDAAVRGATLQALRRVLEAWAHRPASHRPAELNAVGAAVLDALLHSGAQRPPAHLQPLAAEILSDQVAGALAAHLSLEPTALGGGRVAALDPFALGEAVLALRTDAALVATVAERVRAAALAHAVRPAAGRPDAQRLTSAEVLEAWLALHHHLDAAPPRTEILVPALATLCERAGVTEATLHARLAVRSLRHGAGPASRFAFEALEPEADRSADATLPYGALGPSPTTASPGPPTPGPAQRRRAHQLADAARLLAVHDLEALQAVRLDLTASGPAFADFDAVARRAAAYWRAKHEDIEVRPFGAFEHHHFADLVTALGALDAAHPKPEAPPADPETPPADPEVLPDQSVPGPSVLGLGGPALARLRAAIHRRWRGVLAHERDTALLADFSLTLERTLLAEDRLTADVLDAGAAREAAAEDAQWHVAAVRGLFLRLALLAEVRCGLLVFVRPREEGPPLVVRTAIGWPPDPDRGAAWPPGWAPSPSQKEGPPFQKEGPPTPSTRPQEEGPPSPSTGPQKEGPPTRSSGQKEGPPFQKEGPPSPNTGQKGGPRGGAEKEGPPFQEEGPPDAGPTLAVEALDPEQAVRWLQGWPSIVKAHAEPLRVGAGRQRRTGGLMLFGWDAQGEAGRARYRQQAVVRDLLLDTLSIKSMASAQRAFIGRFFSMVAHNLRNPAFVLRSGLKMLEEGRYALSSPDDLRTKYAELYRHAVHMDGIIDSILQFRQQHLEPDVQPVAVALVVRDVVKAVRREVEGRRITLIYEGWQALAETLIHTDRTWIYEIAQNLLSNATKYAPVGSTVQVRLTARLTSRPPRMELAVIDEGPGVPAGERAAIFEMFFRGALAEATRTQGLGLGLYIARAYVEALGHGARLTVDDNPERQGQPDRPGARFTLFVPDLNPGAKAGRSRPEA